MVKDLSNQIYAYAIENRISHEKAVESAVLPKLFQHGLKKEEIKDIMPTISVIVKEVNKLSKEALQTGLEKYGSKA